MRYLFQAMCVGGFILSSACSKGPTTERSTETSLQRANSSALAAVCEETPNNNGCVNGRLLHVASPQWQDQVIYFAMIDRFEDGDSSNNDLGANVYDPSKESHYSGGDLKGITQRLDYIQNLGATALWITPFVANMWWDPIRDYGGYHGYWARDFKAVDEHYGSLEDLKDLTHALHSRGMYFVQDIVVNHTANYFDHQGAFDPNNVSKNLVFNENAVPVSAPTQAPFDKINLLNPEHLAANIYNWTPEIQDFNDPTQQLVYQTAGLDDLNTKNPVVIEALKDSYTYWINEIGVDAFRIDTVKYVDKEFYKEFLHGKNGVIEVAKSTGRENFFVFGEVFNTSLPFEIDGEKKLSQYVSKGDELLLDSAIGFPLYHEINQVFSAGAPTQQLAFRLQAHMEQYPNPYLVPNFIDNHDVERFLAGGSEQSFLLAYTLMMTIPGVPVIYQGDEQGFTQYRKAMFKGGYQSEDDYFHQESAMYKKIQSLTHLRTENPVFTRGSLTVLQSNKMGPGIFAFEREYEGTVATIIINTASNSTLANAIPTPFSKSRPPSKIIRENFDEELRLSASGFTQVLPPLSALVMIGDANKESATTKAKHTDGKVEFLEYETRYENVNNAVMRGKVSEANARLLRVIDGDVDSAKELLADDNGHWEFTFSTRDLGKREHFVEVYWPEKNIVSESIAYTVISTEPEFEMRLEDSVGDAKGLTGTYSAPLDPSFGCQMDIDAVDVKMGGRVLELSLTMCEVTDVWQPSNGYDHVAFSIFFSLNAENGVKLLPVIGGTYPHEKSWHFSHRSFGWGNAVYSSANASEKNEGEVLGVGPKLQVDKHNKRIKFSYDGKHFGLDSWSGVEIYITTWDKDGGGAYRSLGEEAKIWQFGGAKEGGAKIFDSVYLRINP